MSRGMRLHLIAMMDKDSQSRHLYQGHPVSCRYTNVSGHGQQLTKTYIGYFNTFASNATIHMIVKSEP